MLWFSNWGVQAPDRGYADITESSYIQLVALEGCRNLRPDAKSYQEKMVCSQQTVLRNYVENQLSVFL